MKPGFLDYNHLAADACQILAVAEIQYGDTLGARPKADAAASCRELRFEIGKVILEMGQPTQLKSAELKRVEEKAIEKLQPLLERLQHKLPELTKDMEFVSYGKSLGFLAKILFSKKADHAPFNLPRLSGNLDFLLREEKEQSGRSHSGYGALRVIGNIFMQPYGAIECESRANAKLRATIAARMDPHSSAEISSALSA